VGLIFEVWYASAFVDKEAATPAKGMLQEEQRPKKKRRLVESNG
jgi:hypothetical protein